MSTEVRVHEVSEDSVKEAEKRYTFSLVKLDNDLLLFMNERACLRLGTFVFARPGLG
jgi:hypothetical protein